MILISRGLYGIRMEEDRGEAGSSGGRPEDHESEASLAAMI
jgi:hypothetical protein